MHGRSHLHKIFVKNKYLYLLLLPSIIYFIIFRYLPMFGLVITFKDYNIFKGIWGSSWVGLDNFYNVMGSVDFKNIMFNTLYISILKIVIGFPIPIILSLLFNEIFSTGYKRTMQTLIYLPHFISWTVAGAMILSIFSPNFGIFNTIITSLGGEPVNVLANGKNFIKLIILSDIWKSAGWGTVIYLAALSQVDQNLYEAAVVDGANRFQQVVHITLPSIKGVIVTLLIMRIGSIMLAGFEQILVLQNPAVLSVSDIFDTYVYRVGLGRGEYSFTATVDFFKSFVGLVLILFADRIAKILGEEGLI